MSCRFPSLICNQWMTAKSLQSCCGDIFLSNFSNRSIGSTVVYPPLKKSDHVAVSVSINFPLNSRENDLFYCTTYIFLSANCYGLCDRLRDVPWKRISLNLVLLLLLLNFVNGFMMQLMHIFLIVNIRSRLIHLHTSTPPRL